MHQEKRKLFRLLWFVTIPAFSTSFFAFIGSLDSPERWRLWASGFGMVWFSILVLWNVKQLLDSKSNPD